jgi:hypothetical protein
MTCKKVYPIFTSTTPKQTWEDFVKKEYDAWHEKLDTQHNRVTFIMMLFTYLIWMVIFNHTNLGPFTFNQGTVLLVIWMLINVAMMNILAWCMGLDTSQENYKKKNLDDLTMKWVQRDQHMIDYTRPILNDQGVYVSNVGNYATATMATATTLATKEDVATIVTAERYNEV